MSRIIMLILTGISAGLISVNLGVIRAMKRKGARLSVFKPITQPRTGGDVPDQATTIVHVNSLTTTAVEPLKVNYAEGLLSNNQKDVLMKEIVASYCASTKGTEVILVGGLVPTCRHQFVQSLSYEIAKTLNVEIVFVMSQGTDTPEQLEECTEPTRNSFGDAENINITGTIANELNAPVDGQGRTRPDLSEIFDDSSKAKVNSVDPAKLQESSPLPVLGAVPRSLDLIAIRAIDMARYLSATTINRGSINIRRIKSVTFCARGIPHTLEHFRAGSLLVTSTDRPDVPMAACLAAMNGVEAGALLLTGSCGMGVCISKLYERAFATGLPVFMVSTNTRQTSLSLQSFSLEVPVSDHKRTEEVQGYVANYINAGWIESLTATSERNRRLSPPAFRYQLTELARKAGKRIVLPEDDEPRIVKAVAIYAERGIAACVLLGNPAEISRVIVSQDVGLGAGIEIVDPEVARESYVGRLVELHKNKGITETTAREQLEDNVVLGTLVLEQDEVDGLVSGTVHTAVDTVRPSLQLIKAAPGSSLVSSVFSMLLLEQVYVYSDCVINPDPTAEWLAETAIQSADSVATFGIELRAATLSYSTGISGVGSGVEKVREATHLAQGKRPDLTIDGPLQYDIAITADIAKSKAPSSPVAGRATVFIFLDLNAGNIIYKAVQRFADLISIGPTLQGMRKPVNDLSRDILVDDIIHIIVLTATQSAQQQ